MTAVADWLEQRRLHRVILVSDPFHMFRLRLEARRTDLEAYTSPTENSPISDNPVLELRYLWPKGSRSRSRGSGPPSPLSPLTRDLMTLVSSERLYAGRVINLDLDTVVFPTAPPASWRWSGTRRLGGGSRSRRAPRPRPPDPPDPPIPPCGRRLHLGDPGRAARPGRDPRHLRPAGAGGGDRDDAPTCWPGSSRSTPRPASPTSGSTCSWPTSLKPGKHRREPDEFMEVQTRNWSEVMTMIRNGEIRDAKTLVGLMFVDCFRERRATRRLMAVRLWAISFHLPAQAVPHYP